MTSIRSIPDRWIWFRVSLIAAILSNSPTPIHAQTTGLSGLVVGQRTQQPVAAVTVKLGGTALSAVTDEAGLFRIPGVPPKSYQLTLQHVGYGERSVQVMVKAGEITTIRLELTETAVRLDSLNIDALSQSERVKRGSGTSRSVVTREEIQAAGRAQLSFEDLLMSHVAAVRVRRIERVVGAETCIEMRASRVLNTASCLSPAVILDGALMTNATGLYRTLRPEVIERIEVVPANEAGVRYGAAAMYGALVIDTRRPGPPDQRKLPAKNTNFDWGTDAERHKTALVFVASAVGNAAGLALGNHIATQCLHLRQPSNDGLVSDCKAGGTIASALSALVFPALGSGTASRFVGQTEASRGRFAPAAVGAAMAVLPGYAMVMTGKRNQSTTWEYTGYAIMTIGPPLISTAADYLFRKLRD